MYARADIYLLDDPLSAVDAHVGRHLFDRVIGPNGLLATKARLLSTNSIPFVQQADELVLIRKGVIIERGTYASAMRVESELSRLLNEFGHTGSDNDEEGTGSGSEDTVVEEEDLAAKLESEMISSTLRQRASEAVLKKAELVPVDMQKRDTLKLLKASTRPKEKREQGSVKFAVYKNFLRANSYIGVRLCMFQGVLADDQRRCSSTCSRLCSSRRSRSGRTSGCATGPETTRRRAITGTSPST